MTPEQIMKIVADVLELPFEYYTSPRRKREYVDMRIIATDMMRRYCEPMSLCGMARLFGRTDHTTTLNYIEGSHSLRHTKDYDFTYKYNIAHKAVKFYILGVLHPALSNVYKSKAV